MWKRILILALGILAIILLVSSIMSAAKADYSHPPVSVVSQDMLDRLLREGKITQATFDAYKTWLSQKPTAELPAPEDTP